MPYESVMMTQTPTFHYITKCLKHIIKDCIAISPVVNVLAISKCLVKMTRLLFLYGILQPH